jgi:hypothetical protein
VKVLIQSFTALQWRVSSCKHRALSFEYRI